MFHNKIQLLEDGFGVNFTFSGKVRETMPHQNLINRVHRIFLFRSVEGFRHSYEWGRYDPYKGHLLLKYFLIRRIKITFAVKCRVALVYSNN